MTIPTHTKTNFHTLHRAFANDDVCLMECTRKDNGEPVDVICAVMTDGDEVIFVPFAYMPRDHVIYDVVDMPEGNVAPMQ